MTLLADTDGPPAARLADMRDAKTREVFEARDKLDRLEREHRDLCQRAYEAALREEGRLR